MLTGFKAGVGFVIVVDQMPKLLGIHIHKEGFFRDVVSIVAHVPELSWPTLAVAVGTLAVIAFAKRFLPKSPAPLLAVAVGIAASAVLGLEAAGVSVVGTIQGGLPTLMLPRPALFEAMWPAAAGIALISFTESIAAARAFVATGGSAHRRESRTLCHRRRECRGRVHRLDARRRRHLADGGEPQGRRADPGRLAGGRGGGLRDAAVPRAGAGADAPRHAWRRWSSPTRSGW